MADYTIGLQYKPDQAPFDPMKAMTAMSTIDVNKAHAKLYGAEADKTTQMLPLQMAQTRAATAHTNALSALTGVQTAEHRRKMDDTDAFVGGKMTLDEYRQRHPVEAEAYARSQLADFTQRKTNAAYDALKTGDPDEVAKHDPVMAEQLAKLHIQSATAAHTIAGYKALSDYARDQSAENYGKLLGFPEHLSRLSDADHKSAQAEEARAKALEARANISPFSPYWMTGGVQASPRPPAPAPAPVTPAPTPAPQLPGGSPDDSGPAPTSNAALGLPDQRPAGAAPAASAAPGTPIEPQESFLNNLPPQAANLVRAVHAGFPLNGIAEQKLRDQVTAAHALAYGDMKGVNTGTESYSHVPGTSTNEKGEPVSGTWTYDNKKPVGADNPVFQSGVIQTNKAPAAGSTLSPETLDRISDQVVKNGDYSGTVGMSRNAANVAALQNAITDKMNKLGKTPKDITLAKMENTSMMKAYTAIGNREAQLGMAAKSAEVLFPNALQASEKVNRTKFPDINKILIAAKEKTGSEDVIRFGLAVQAVTATYASVFTRGGQSTDAAREVAEKTLQRAWSKGQFEAGIDQLGREIEAELGAPGLLKEHLRASFGGDPAKIGRRALIRDKEGWDMLAPGSKFMMRNGKTGIKQADGTAKED